ISQKCKTCRDHQRHEERCTQKSGFTYGTNNEKHPFENMANTKGLLLYNRHLSPKNTKPAVIINVMKSAVHKSRDLLTERITRRTHLKIWPTQKACYCLLY